MIYFAIGILVPIIFIVANYIKWKWFSALIIVIAMASCDAKYVEPYENEVDLCECDSVIYRSTGAPMCYPDGRTPREEGN